MITFSRGGGKSSSVPVRVFADEKNGIRVEVENVLLRAFRPKEMRGLAHPSCAGSVSQCGGA